MIALAMLLQAQATPPPVLQVTADCARPVYATDMLVCGDSELKALDGQLREAFRQPVEPQPAALLEQPFEWFKRSRQCAFRPDQRACVAAAYREATAAHAGAEGLLASAGKCRLASGIAADLARSQDGIRLLLDGRVVGYGAVASPEWRPFLRVEQSGVRVVLRQLDGKVAARCRLRS